MADAEPNSRAELDAAVAALPVRKQLLFWTACCRRTDDLLRDDRVRRALDLTEAFADGSAGIDELVALHSDLHSAVFDAFDGRYSAEAQADFCIHPADSLASAVECAAYAVGTLFERAVGDRTPPVVDLSTVQGRTPHQHARGALACRAGAMAVWAYNQEAPGCRGRPRSKVHKVHRFVYDRLRRDEELVQVGLVSEIRAPGTWPDLARWRTGDVVGLARGVYEDRAFDRLGLLADALQDAGCSDEQVLGHCRSDGHVRGCWLIDLVLGKS
jgi:hypothetical protein